MRAAVFDLETNGLLDKVTKVHCLVIRDLQTGNGSRFNEMPGNKGVAAGIEILSRYDTIIAHNGIKYDLPVLQKLYGWAPRASQQIIDTIVLARLLFPDMWESDAKLVAAGKLDGNLRNSHSLKAWGQRLGKHKGDYTGGWESWNQAMEDYCVQDTDVTKDLYEHCMRRNPDPRSVQLEHAVATVIARQERHGFYFDVRGAAELYATLVAKRLDLEHRLREAFAPMYLPAGELTPKRDNRKEGYCSGAPLTKVNLTMFNPGSRHHIARWLEKRRGWKPKDFTDNGQPKIDEQVIGALKYPEAKLLSEYLLVEKRIGQLAEGKEAWMKAADENGVIRGSVNTNGAVTGRMTHSRPNMAQVPASRSLYGHECRALFRAMPGYVLVGADADALELRCLAGYMAAYDKGAYIEVVLKGRKEDGTDIHSVNARAIGLDPKGCYLGSPKPNGRDIAKTFFYAFLYGAGDQKLGATLTGKRNASSAGKAGRAALLKNLPALGKLSEAVKRVAKTRGYLVGLDGRHIPVRSEHAALNTLLQGAGAILMKQALVLLDASLQGAGLAPGVDYEFVANVHDEWQIETKPEFKDAVGQAAVEAIRAAGEALRFACPLDGQWCAGQTWADTH